VAGVRLTGLVKQFDGPVAAVENLTLDIADGEFHVLVGPSGCGKTTVLRLIAGLEEPTAGSITIGDRDVTWLPPRDRDVAMVFQNYALYPHLNVWDNIAFGLRMRRVPRATIARQVAAAADLLAIGDLLRRRPGQLSGGQRQRVALARAIVREPRVFLFDEPLSNLDAQVRAHTRAELVKLHRRLGTTMIYVTHDQVEAMTMAQRVSVLHAGRVLHRSSARPRSTSSRGGWWPMGAARASRGRSPWRCARRRWPARCSPSGLNTSSSFPRTPPGPPRPRWCSSSR
jgi:multiple sugar transport system ATP-binding protein